MSTRRLDLDEWWWLVQGGEDPVRAAHRCGVGIAAVCRAASRAGRIDMSRVANIARTAERNETSRAAS